jgi:hypothetical protein
LRVRYTGTSKRDAGSGDKLRLLLGQQAWHVSRRASGTGRVQRDQGLVPATALSASSEANTRSRAVARMRISTIFTAPSTDALSFGLRTRAGMMVMP